jgi:mycothiol maleylpyruvate isomerase-like protein
VADGRELAGLDPFALLDGEAERLDAFFSGLGESGWNRASRCAGWTVRDVLGHLTLVRIITGPAWMERSRRFWRASPGAAVRTWTR